MNSRRSFIRQLVAFSVAPHFLPSAGRLWKATYKVAPVTFQDLLIRESGKFFPAEVFKRVYAKSIWTSFVQRGTYPVDLGETAKLLTYP